MRLASNDWRWLDWLVGGYYSHEITPSVQTVPAIDSATGAAVGQLLYSAFPLKLDEIAGFADLTFHFTNRFNIQVGGRESRNRLTYDELDSGALIGGTSVLPTERTSDSAFTYLITPQFKFSRGLMVYARVASGYRTGGPNPSAAVLGLPATFKPDETTNYEVGIKGSLFERALTYDADIFHIDWKDVQLQQRDPATQFAYFTNAGKARSQGLELSAQTRPFQGLRLSGSLSYTDATLQRALPSGSYGLSGDRLPYSPKLAATLNVDEDWRLTDTITGFAGVSASYEGNRFGDFPAQTPPTQIRPQLPAYTVVDLRTGVRMDPWTATLFVRNVADERGILNASPLGKAAGINDPYTVVVVRPRTVGLSLAATF